MQIEMKQEIIDRFELLKEYITRLSDRKIFNNRVLKKLRIIACSGRL